LRSTDTIYVDWAAINAGSVATTKTFYTALSVDGTLRTYWTTAPPLNPNFYAYVSDYSIGSLSAGTHTIKIVVDVSNVVTETNESDNTYTKTITVN
jgi:subtilase family serine protease